MDAFNVCTTLHNIEYNVIIMSPAAAEESIYIVMTMGCDLLSVQSWGGSWGPSQLNVNWIKMLSRLVCLYF